MKIKLTLIRKYFETSEVETFIFKSEQRLEYTAGQYLRYTLIHPDPDERGVSRYFTIASAPSEGHIQLTTKISPTSSTFKQALQKLQLNDQVEAEGPLGSFVFNSHLQQMVWIAGGIGITPFRSILNQLDFASLNPNIILLYANRTPEIPFQVLLDNLSFKHNNLKLVYTVDQPTPGWSKQLGKIDEKFIKKYVTDISISTFYISGPEPMVISFTQMLEAMGIDKARLKRDAFPGYD